MAQPPTTYEDRRHRPNDPWDHDAVCWMLDQLGPGSKWTYHNLFECARKQQNRLDNDVDRVVEAAALCGRLNVDQLRLLDPKKGKWVVRLRRRDVAAPEYPAHYDAAQAPAHVSMKVSAEERAAAAALMELLGEYEQELIADGKSPTTVETYVDRARRFLARVQRG